MSLYQRLRVAVQAASQLGFEQAWSYARYQIGLRSGAYRLLTSGLPGLPTTAKLNHQLFIVPAPEKLAQTLGANGVQTLLDEAGEILSGEARLFGSEPAPIQLDSPAPKLHWTLHERGHAGFPKEDGDIKLLWEPARFGWACTLGRAYTLGSDERYCEAFWVQLHTFLQANPPYVGWHWTSGQEVGLRLISLAFCWACFHASPHSTPERQTQLAQTIAAHAARIPPTLVYARAQNNNHLLSEMAALYTAGILLPDHPDAPTWAKTGWQGLNLAFQRQITEDGAYVQNSTNYHRLALQIALWIDALRRQDTAPWPEATQRRLEAATRWLLALIDPNSGRTPNLGPNDGAYILPLTIADFADYRPVVQAAGLAFLGSSTFTPGIWDELSLWLGLDPLAGATQAPSLPFSGSPVVIRHPSGKTWAYLRIARFIARPGHADQLHFDLWHESANLTLDPGTYRYNAPPPWENSLTGADVHNTVTVDGCDQMKRVGRFLYLDWAQAELIHQEKDVDGRLYATEAQHDGYSHVGVLHRRRVTLQEGNIWVVRDELIPSEKAVSGSHDFRLHWLLIDGEWQLDLDDKTSTAGFIWNTPNGKLLLEIRTNLPDPRVELYRAGVCLAGLLSEQPRRGWYSPTYNCLIPALSLSVSGLGSLPVRFESRFILPE